jgi:hypothetical protein
MLGTFFYLLGFALPILLIGFIASLISKAKWVDKKFPQLSNKLSKALNMEITKKEALFGVTIGPENSNHIMLGKHKTRLSVKYFYNFKKSFSYDIVKWEYEKEQPIDDIILSIKTNIENTESLQNHNS